MNRRQIQVNIFLISTLFIAGCSGSLQNKNSTTEINLPGRYRSYTLLPNGWKLTPAGSQVEIGELPLNLLVTRDEKYAITSNSGQGENTLSVIDLENKTEVQRIIINKTWRGLAFNGDESQLFVSGGNNNVVYIYNFTNHTLALQDSIILGERYPKENISVSGIDYLKSKDYLLVVSKESNALYVCSVKSKNIIKIIPFDSKCFDIKINHSETFAYVSLWGAASVAEVNLENFNTSNLISVGDHPCDLTITKDDSRLYVTNANNNSTSIVDLNLKRETEKLNSSLSADAPYGSTPNSVCLNKDESVLIVANADNNYLALFDVSKKQGTKSLGFIPVGWYPTSVRFLPDKNRIIAANGKGLSSLPDPDGPDPTKKGKDNYKQFIGSLFKGTISIIDFPDASELESYTKKVYSNTPYTLNDNFISSQQNVIPLKHNRRRSDKIKYVFYIIKENRTYDQVFGDIKKGNGDSSLCLFGKEITPNEHKLVNSFTLFDNFYVDAEVSPDGHNWSTAAYASDYVEKNWPVIYGRRGGTYDFEGGVHIAAPSSGYIWNDVLRQGLTIRNYGEFVGDIDVKSGKYKARDEDLNKYTCHDYPGFDLSISDVTRYEKWLAEFNKYTTGDSLPVFNIIRLPNDHTSGTKNGSLTPTAYAAQNDYALGMMVEKISKSKFWKESIIFVLEDDAQNGPDHVDAHRSTLLVISPYIKRNFVDHTMYSTSGVLRTIELILGLPPMTQFDLSAAPILNCVLNNPDFTPYNSLQPLINIDKKNTAGGYGSKRSGEMNFTTEDNIPDVELNEIIWKSIKGKNSIMPSPVRSAFVKVHTSGIY